jgi:hypothetical protein
MLRIVSKLGLLAVLSFGSLTLAAQNPPTSKYKTQELSEKTGVPVLMEHLPEWEAHRSSAVFATSADEVKATVGARPVLDQIEFTPGTEAVAANYDAGKLLILEYASPEVSAEVDKIAADNVDASTAYRRIGNYNAFVFDVSDKAAANALLDQIKYEKDIQWLGNNPFRISPERAFAMTTADIFMSTLWVILIGIGLSIVGGIVTGFVFFSSRERYRRSLPTFSDAGGMTRLNLDGLTPDIAPSRLLGD